MSNLVAGATANLSVDGATANGMVGLAYSLAGPGPSSVVAGSCGTITASLSSPISVMGVFPADGSGSLTHMQSIPAGASGVQVWLQGLDLASCTLTNSLAETVG